MFQEKVQSLLRDYRPDRLNYEERLGLLEEFKGAIREEEAPLQRIKGELEDLLEAMASSSDLEDLAKHHYFLNHLAIRAFEESRSVRDVHLICTRGRDVLLKRVLDIAAGEVGDDLPPYAWMALGSAGRGEETLYTDQDYLLVYPDGAEDGQLEALAKKAVEYLERIGIRKCKGGVMPSNAKWRGSLGQWKERIEKTLERGRGPLSSLDLMILMDLRPVAGDSQMAQAMTALLPLLASNRGLLNEMLQTIIFIPLPLGLLGRFLVEKSGINKGKLNLKTGGWAPLVVLVRVMAISYGVRETGTLERIEGLVKREVISPKLATDLKEAYHIFMGLRISRQKELMLRGEEDSNYIDPYALDPTEQKRLKFALKKVEELQKVANEIFFGRGRD